ncbi:MAG: hypothetical protein Q9218_000791 [Villophora microphyllina]
MSLNDLWEGAAKNPYHPTVPKERQFLVALTLLLIGIAFLEKALFTSYTYSAPAETQAEDDEDDDDTIVFQISLTALLETLQIFGVNEVKDRWTSRESAYGGIAGSRARGSSATPFGNRVLGVTGMCRMSYAAKGEPLCIVLEESGITTTCEMVTYEPDYQDEIPLQRDALALKIIMRSHWLYDAVIELSSTSPSRLTIEASPSAPYLVFSSTGALGSATIEFSKDQQLLETFQVPKRTVNSYKHSLIKAASRAMQIATKVSIRGDEQGVLSLQFMIEIEGGGVSFIDFRFVPLLPEEGEEDEADNDEGDDDDDDDDDDDHVMEAVS